MSVGVRNNPRSDRAMESYRVVVGSSEKTGGDLREEGSVRRRLFREEPADTALEETKEKLTLREVKNLANMAADRAREEKKNETQVRALESFENVYRR